MESQVSFKQKNGTTELISLNAEYNRLLVAGGECSLD